MDRALRIATFWNWLPAFRTVAEFGSIHRAALALHLSPSALSRTIRLLEEAVEMPLFVRSATGLTLTEAGTEFLRGTRDAMRQVDDAFARTAHDTMGAASWRVATAAASGAAFGRIAARSLATLLGGRTDGPSVRLRITTVAEDRIVQELVRGEVDVVLCDMGSAPESNAEIGVETLGELELALYEATERRHERSDRVVTLMGTEALVPQSKHAIAAAVTTLDEVETLAEHGRFHALLPTTFPPAHFVRSSDETIGTLRAAAVLRRPLAERGPLWTDDFLDLVRRHLTRV